jgi:hypothetical protein
MEEDEMRISVEKGRMFGVAWPWVRFVLANTDIMTTVNHAPLQVKKASRNEFLGRIFGVTVKMEVIQDAKPDPKDEVHIIADVSMPFCLGRTHTVAHYRYSAAAASTTMVDLQLTLDTVGPAMALYAMSLRRRIDDYLNQVMCDNERAGTLLQENDAALKELLNEEQLARVAEFRREWGKAASSPQHTEETISLPKPHDQQAWHPELAELTVLFESVQGKASLLEQELVRIREMRDAVATLLVARRMLEVIVAQICEEKMNRPRGNEPLAGILGKIGHEHIVPEYVVTSMENLNRLSTYGAHPKDFSPRQVREALLALCSIMEWYVSAGMKSGSSKESRG